MTSNTYINQGSVPNHSSNNFPINIPTNGPTASKIGIRVRKLICLINCDFSSSSLVKFLTRRNLSLEYMPGFLFVKS